MDEELRLALILLGTLAIGSVILHGVWTIRRTVNQEKKVVKQEEQDAEPVVEPEEQEAQKLKLKQMEMDFATLAEAENKEDGIPVASVNMDSIYQANDKEQHIDEIAPEVNTAQTELISDDLSEPEEQPSFSTELEVEDDELPQFSTIEVDDEESTISLDTIDDSEAATNKPSESEQKQEVLMLFVDKPDGDAIDGAKLLPTLLTLGFKYGEMDFFHRHQDSSGKGEVLFSLANMYNPGTFDIDNMEQLETRGLTIFMTLPNAIEPLQAFNMMHNAAKKIADEFGATVLDDKRRPLDVAIVRSYVEKIRKF